MLTRRVIVPQHRRYLTVASVSLVAGAESTVSKASLRVGWAVRTCLLLLCIADPKHHVDRKLPAALPLGPLSSPAAYSTPLNVCHPFGSSSLGKTELVCAKAEVARWSHLESTGYLAVHIEVLIEQELPLKIA